MNARIFVSRPLLCLFLLGTLLPVTPLKHVIAAPDTAMGLPPTISAGTQVQKLATLPSEPYTIWQPFTEGATCAPNGDIYFVEQNSNKIFKWSVGDKALSLFMHPAGYANGMSFDAKGNLIACADERNELWSISLTQTETISYPQPLNPAVGEKPTAQNITRPTHKVIMNGYYNGKLLGGPNDLWIRPDGGIYFTDPFYKRPWWAPGRQQEQELKTVYFLSPDYQTLTRVLPSFLSSQGTPGTPNGIIGTPDGKTLYVSDIGGNETWWFSIGQDGTLTNKTLVCPFGSDGMTLDEQGLLYLSAGAQPPGVTVVDTKSGKQVGFIPVPEPPANMCFGGKDRKTLYITARAGLYSIETNVKGANLAK